MSASTIALTAANLESTIRDNEIVLIDFWASWCGPCRMFGPIFEKVAAKHTDIAFAKCDTENAPDVAAQFNVVSIPTLAIFRQGVLLFQQAGVVPEAGLEDLIRQVRALDMDQVKAEVAAQAAKA